ncbi:hypothetical protein F0562_015308 [Nyssa sinensis]|uniref:Uncharacterized protein n=1 Tax=Nyssa sinensis TaxID=561372 RepID=A0A5J4ZKP6_9ASTE|nr:hypothetical protein F0562_015308 [Nyssa sinensis]
MWVFYASTLGALTSVITNTTNGGEVKALDLRTEGLSGIDLDGETDRALLRWFYLHSSGTKDSPASSSDASASTAILGDNNPTPTERNSSFHQSLNTDSNNRILVPV